MVQKNLATAAIVAGLLAFGSTSGSAQDLLVNDSFALSETRKAGTPLKGLNTEDGTPWKVQGAVALRPEGSLTVTTENGAGGTAWVALPAPPAAGSKKGSIRLQADINPAGTGWVGLTLGGDLNLYFQGVQLATMIWPNGRYDLFANQTKTTVSSGKIENFVKDGANTTVLEYDEAANSCTLTINGKVLVERADLGKFNFHPNITTAGVRFQPKSTNTMVGGAAAVDNFTVSGQVPQPFQAPTLTPVRVEDFFLAPDTEVRVSWKLAANPPVAELNYTVCNYAGKEISNGKATVVDGRVEVPVKMAAGYYEISFKEAAATYGLVALPAKQGAADPYFSIDAGLSWLEQRPEIRESLVKVLKRSGIAMARERLSWNSVNKTPDAFDFETPRKYDTMRASYAKNGVDVLEILFGAPGFTSPTVENPFPAKLGVAAKSISAVAKHWEKSWGAVEVWNEPDYGQGGNMPADQYVPTVKATAFALAQNQQQTPIGGGVFAAFNPAYIGQSIQNGMLDNVDFVSFHSYSKAPSVENMVRDYRSALRAGGREDMPLWLSECGLPWPSGPDRPGRDADSTSALEIAAKAMESRAAGVARYFPFVLTYFVEPGKNFGLLGKECSPLRGMAGYVQVTRVLSDKKYVGDLKSPPMGVRLARAFGDGAQTLFVLYSGEIKAGAKVALPFAANRIEGVDGRVLATNADGSVPLDDGMVYLWADNAAAAPFLVRDTNLAKLWNLGQAKPKPRAAPSPIVLQYIFDRTIISPSTSGYRLPAAQAARLPVTVRAHNLANEEKKVTLVFEVDGVAVQAPEVIVAPLGSADVTMAVDLWKSLETRESITVVVDGSDGSPVKIQPLALNFSAERELDEYKKLYPSLVKIDITDLKRWQKNISPNGTQELTVTPEGIWSLKATFTNGASWVFPRFAMAGSAGLEKGSAILVRARALKPGKNYITLREGNGAAYTIPPSLVPDDGQWHTRLVRFSDLTPAPTAPPDPNWKLDMNEVKVIELGMTPSKGEGVLEVSDVYVVTGN